MDVGFGDSFLEPLRLKPEIEQEQDGGRFRMVAVGEVLIVQRKFAEGIWKSLYQFTFSRGSWRSSKRAAGFDDLARVALHPSTGLHIAHQQRPDHALGSQADSDHGQEPAKSSRCAMKKMARPLLAYFGVRL